MENQFLKWFDDKLQVIVAVLIVTGLGVAFLPAQMNLDIVYGGLFGIATGYSLGKVNGTK